MMNDRFSAELRKHLLETANERMADGQLGALLDRVETTRQRPPILARLTWTPGRIGPVPSVAIRYALIAVALALAMVAGALLAGGGGGGRTTVFEGSWITIDPGDGSGMSLVVGAGMSPPVYFEDGYASGAACVADAVKRFTARGTSTIVGNVLKATYPEGGGCGLIKVDVAGRYEYVHDSDTLQDQDGVIWSRALGGGSAPQAPSQVPATVAPATDVPSTDVPATDVPSTDGPGASSPLDSVCIEFDGGGTYTAPVGGLSLTATVPTTGSWHGLRHTFHLVRSSCQLGGPVVFEAPLVDAVFADACDWAGPSTSVDTAAEAAAALAAQSGSEVSEPTDMTVGGFPASRIQLSVPAAFDATPCRNGVLRLWTASGDDPEYPGQPADPGASINIYLIDFKGSVVALTETHSPGDETEIPTLVAEIDSIVSSLQIEAGP